MSFLLQLLHWHILVLWKVARREETSRHDFFVQCNQRMYLQQQGLTIWFRGTPKATIISEKPCFLDSAMCVPLLLFMTFYITVLPFLLMHCGVFYPSINFYMSGCLGWNGTRILQLSGSWHFVNKKGIKAKKSGVVRSSKWDGKIHSVTGRAETALPLKTNTELVSTNWNFPSVNELTMES